MPFIIAIDGPAGAGKSSVARRLATALDFTYLDTGAMYRAVALAAQENGVAETDEAALETLAQELSLQFSPLAEDGTQRLAVQGRDVTAAIRTPPVSSLTSKISALPAVRRVIVEQQRRMGAAAERGVVLEGRDIGTVVFPQAQLKIFLTASPEERARRRAEELTERGLPVSYADILREQIERDQRDSSRADSPLAAASDALLLNTDGLTLPEVVARILTLYHQARSQ